MSETGFWIENDVLSQDECDALAMSLAKGVHARGRAGARHLTANPEVRALSYDSRLLHRAAEVLGGRAVPYRVTLFEKSGRANWLVVWHQDTAIPLAAQLDDEEWGPWSTKAGVLYAHAPAWALDRIVALRVHLDASTRDNGPLRVIPGTHSSGVLSDDEVIAHGRKKEAIDCVVGRGGVLAMRPLLIHSSSKARGDDPRRVLHIEYAETLDLGPGVRLAVA
jgi:hypothetical protein